MTQPLRNPLLQEMLPDINFSRMYTIAETAGMIGYSEWQTRRLFRQGILRGIKAPTAAGAAAKNSRIMIFGHSIRAFIEQGIRNAQR